MLDDTIKHLNQRKAAIVKEIAALNAEDAKIDKVIAAIGALPVKEAAPEAMPTKKKVSAATRAKMRKAQQARHAAKQAPVAVTPAAPAVKPAKGKAPMSPLGKLRIKLGALKRYKKTAEAKKVAAQIAALEAQAAKK